MPDRFFSKDTDLAPVAMHPPAPRYEPVTQARPGFVWMRGYWDWQDRRHVWVPGKWEPARRGYRWLPHRWVLREGHWYLQHGGWGRDAELETVTARPAQIAAKEERI